MTTVRLAFVDNLGVVSKTADDRVQVTLSGQPRYRAMTSITAIDGLQLRVRSLEALDGTPIIDVKPVLGEGIDER